MMLKFVVLLAALVGFASAAGSPPVVEGDENFQKLQSLCKGKTIDLTSIGDLGRLDSAIETQQLSGDSEDKLECSEHIVSAIKKLQRMQTWFKDEPCSPESISSYKEYFMEFLDTTTEEKNINLPISLRTFALAYGMELGRFCRLRSAKVLQEIEPILSATSEFKQVEFFVGEDRVLEKLFSFSGTEPEDFFLPTELPDRQITPPTKHIFRLLKKPQTICRRRFKPIYDQLLMPVVQLGHLGFSSKDGELKDMHKKMHGDSKRLKDASKPVKMWSRIIFLCEGLKHFDIKQREDQITTEEIEGGHRVEGVLRKPDATEAEDDKPESHESDGPKQDGSPEANPLEAIFFSLRNNYYEFQFPHELVRPMDLKQRESLLQINTDINERMGEKMALKYKALHRVAGYLATLQVDLNRPRLWKHFQQKIENRTGINGLSVRTPSLRSLPRVRNIIPSLGKSQGNDDANGDPGPSRHDASDHNNQDSTSTYDARMRETSGGDKVALSDSAAAQMRSPPELGSDAVTLLSVIFILGFGGPIMDG